MSQPQNIIAVVFDFDDTLTDDSTTKLLEAHGIATTDFWQNQMKRLVDAGWDSPMAYLQLILNRVGEGKPFGNLTNQGLHKFGAKLKLYAGLPGVFSDLHTAIRVLC